MSSDGENTKLEELVIIRRRSGGEDAPHKGGVWKIAYADFMTAMMTFFLVMWLINAADKRTITQVASYFNPVRLTDKSPTNKGLQDPGGGVEGKEKQEGKAPDKEGKSKSEGEPESGAAKFSEEAFYKDPYGVLAKLAEQAPPDLRLDPEARGGDRGKAFRDPFEPAFRREQLREGTEPGKASGDAGDKLQPGAASQPRPGDASANDSGSGQGQEKPQDKAQGQAQEKAALEKAALEKSGREAAARLAARKIAIKADADKIDAEIKHVFRRSLPGTIPRIDVTVTDEGVLISLTDDKNFGMFAVASAEPRPATVVMMEAVARILASRAERLVIRGHTDARPYRAGNYDNWRLSTARAHIAYVMLARGGVEEKRFERVEGHADRNLRVPGDPEAAQNRRIEILLRRASS